MELRVCGSRRNPFVNQVVSFYQGIADCMAATWGRNPFVNQVVSFIYAEFGNTEFKNTLVAIPS